MPCRRSLYNAYRISHSIHVEKQLSVPVSRGVQICKKTMMVVVGRAFGRSRVLRESIANHTHTQS